MTENEEFEYVAPAVRPNIQLSPGQSTHEVAYRTAHDLLSRRFPVEALEILEPALADDPNNFGLRSMRAWAYMLRAQLAKAETELRWLVARDPSDAWSQHSLGRVLERQDRLEDALGPLRLAAVMSDDYDHHAAVYRVGNRLAQRQE
ncbi:tetratricopeptide repeat protein [Nocardioides sp. NPDC058538]|uniref:tetratricopeptide repeat protein n=1 Tax=Nocardioides sp. NPDC058538 TaxID=3346542 RepID=UPI003659A5C4